MLNRFSVADDMNFLVLSLLNEPTLLKSHPHHKEKMHTSSREIPDIDPAYAGFKVARDGFIFYQDSPLYLPPKERGALKLLLQAWPTFVSKSDFNQCLWAGRMSDESLARCMTQLRHALSHLGVMQIDSLYGLGYRLTVLSDKVDQPAPTQALPAIRQPDTATIHPALTRACAYAQQLLENQSAAGFDQAESTIREVISHAPGYMNAKLVLAQCIAGKISCGLEVNPALVEDAWQLLALVADAAPETPGLQSQMGHLLDCKWRFGEARIMHEQALRLTPEDAVAYFHHGLHLLATNAPAEAVTAFRCAVELNPFSPNLSLMLMRAMALCGVDPADIVIQARNTCRIYPESQQAYVYLLHALATNDPQPEFAHAARQITLSNASGVFWGGKISYILARCNDQAGALDIIAAQSTKTANMRAMHAPALIAMGRIDQAMALIKEATYSGCGPLPLLMNALENAELKRHSQYAAVHASVFRLMPAAATYAALSASSAGDGTCTVNPQDQDMQSFSTKDTYVQTCANL
ncbi:MAG: hypothetical protein ABI171_00340 [Collimonas sp.]|uniref:hypothetical protein n=1 Tax=Collimonas sp. TaxID=1963772 RepID=UPI003263C150